MTGRAILVLESLVPTPKTFEAGLENGRRPGAAVLVVTLAVKLPGCLISKGGVSSQARMEGRSLELWRLSSKTWRPAYHGNCLAMPGAGARRPCQVRKEHGRTPVQSDDGKGVVGCKSSDFFRGASKETGGATTWRETACEAARPAVVMYICIGP